MPRKPRFAPPGYNLHITQRGNCGQRTFHTRQDYQRFLDLLAHYAPAHGVDILAYCLMPNHFHLLAHGHRIDSISDLMRSLNGRYAQYIHGRLVRRGRFWQNRFYCCLLDNAHLVAALRYVELNPVRANLVTDAVEYAWSTASIHVGATATPHWLQMSTFNELFSHAEWVAKLAEGQLTFEQVTIRDSTQREIPLGTPAFLHELETTFNRKLHTPQPVGRPRNP